MACTAVAKSDPTSVTEPGMAAYQESRAWRFSIPTRGSRAWPTLAIDLDRRTVDRRGVQREVTAGPLNENREVLTRVVAHDVDQLAITRDRDAVNGDDLVADLHPASWATFSFCPCHFVKSPTPT